jgi:hypothetical protein
MTREEEIISMSVEYTESRRPMCIGGQSYGEVTFQMNRNHAFEEGAKWADKTMIERACKCFCDDICEKSRCGMCFYKYDGEYNVKVTFKYNECPYLELIRKSMIGDKL